MRDSIIRIVQALIVAVALVFSAYLVADRPGRADLTEKTPDSVSFPRPSTNEQALYDLFKDPASEELSSWLDSLTSQSSP